MSSAPAHDRAENGFDRFQLASELNRGLESAGFDTPREIQAETIPAALEGDDVLGLAQTGTGKTAAFALPILQWLLEEPGKGPLVLILAPTRELANQIDAEIRMLAKYTKIETVTVFGGVSQHKQVKGLRRRPEIVVGCPGRVLDLLEQRELDLSQIETLVLDEADHMFDMGFLPSIQKIIRALPKERQNLLFSATMPKAIRELANKILHKPHVVELATSAPAETIEHALYPISEGRKRALLDRLLEEDDCKTAIVFTRTKHRAKRLALQLAKGGLEATALQGNMSQPQRDRAMQGFRDGRFDILVATDIAARGLDVAGVDYVINYDPPSTPETYTHRIGRTGRSEATGKACTFVTGEDRAWIRDTERVLGEPIARRELEDFDPGAGEPVPLDDRRERGNRGGGGGGRSRRSSSRGGGGGSRGTRGGRGRNGESRDGQNARSGTSPKKRSAKRRGGSSSRGRRGPASPKA